MTQLQTSRISSTRKLLLSEQLIQRGARTPTIHRLTGVPEVTIRTMYHDLNGKGPTRGPSSYSYLWFTEVPKRQFAASVAGNALRYQLVERWNEPAGEFLGEAYIQAFDFFVAAISQWRHYHGEINFERFASLGHFLTKRNPLDFMTCNRCTKSFVGNIKPNDGIPQSTCPACQIMCGRECAHCGRYVPLEFGDFPPQRAPCCIACAVSEQRVTTLENFLMSKSIYPTSKCDEHVPRATEIVIALRPPGLHPPA